MHCQSLLLFFRLIYISFVLVTILSGKAMAKTCSTTELREFIKRFETADEVALDIAVHCDTAAIPTFINAIKTARNERVRYQSAYVLGAISQGTVSALPALEEALGDPSDLVRPYVINAIGDLRSVAKPAIPALLQTLKHTHAKTRAQTAIALGSIGLEAKVVVPELIKTLNTDQDAEVQANAASALSKFGVEAKEAIPPLMNALKHKDDSMRFSSASSLGSIAETLLDEAKKTKKLDKMNETLTVLSNIDKALSNPEFEDVKKPVVRSLDNLKQALLVEGATQWGTNGVDIWLAHLAFWLALIFAYPKSRQIQAFFFWNPWVRTIFGWGYVTFLLAWVPCLRRWVSS